MILPKVFTARGTFDKIFWLIGHLAGAAVALFAFWQMFNCDTLLMQNVWLAMWVICLAVPPIAFFWVGHPKKRGETAAEKSPSGKETTG